MKKFFVLMLILFCFPLGVKALEIQSRNAILYNLNEDTILFSKGDQEKIPIASLTKIMTAIVALENITNLDEVVTVPSKALEGLALKNAMVVGFRAGERITYRDLLYGMLLPSGADATNIVAYCLVGSEEGFVNLMNEKARELGLLNTHFSDTSGLDDYNNYSTVFDIATLLKYALQNTTFKQVFTSHEYITSNGLKLESTLKYYTVKYHLQNSYILGSKTGFTTIAGYCLASYASYDDVEYLLVTAGAPTENGYPYHFQDAFTIYDYCTQNYGYLTLYNKGDVLYTLKTQYASEDSYEVFADESLIKYLPKNTNMEDLQIQYTGVEMLSPFTPKGKIGMISVFLNDTLLKSIEVVYQGNLTFSFSKIFLEYPSLFLGFFLLIFIFFLLFKRNKLHHKKKKV